MPALAGTLHVLRTRARATAATLCAAAQTALVGGGNQACTDADLGRRFGISPAAVAKWFDPCSGVALTLGDLLAMPKAIAREVLVRALASLDDDGPADTRASLDRITVELGAAVHAFATDMADGKLDDPAAVDVRLTRIAVTAMRGLSKGVTP